MIHNKFDTLGEIRSSKGPRKFYRLSKLEDQGLGAISRLPYSIRILLESVLRNCDDKAITEDHVRALAGWSAKDTDRVETPFAPARVLLQDYTGVPAIVDIAAMRSAFAKLGGDPTKIKPRIPVDLVIDHSVQVDRFGEADALRFNAEKEFERNQERYEFLKWAQSSFDNFRVTPPATGIVHQVNLEFLACVVFEAEKDGQALAYPDTLVGADSHTPMINGLGVLGWGVGGIEAEAAMLGLPIFMLTPAVVGVRLSGALPDGATATDLVLIITQKLRHKGVVGSFVEYFGKGLSTMTLADRATISNMSPEQGATVGYFPVDNETLRYMNVTGRSPEHIDLVERYYKEQGLFRTDETSDPEFSDIVEIDLGEVEPSVAGPKRPQDLVALKELKKSFHTSLMAPAAERGFDLTESDLKDNNRANNGALTHGSIVIAAITSCTNTSNPSVMLAAGLLAKKAVDLGLKTAPHVKTSLAPGSKVVTEYLTHSGLLPYLEKLGYYVVAYGCTTCIGNSGPLPEDVARAIEKDNLVVASALSGNRNFEGRINQAVKASYLASPPLVVAFGLAGRIDIDFETEPLGTDDNGKPVFLKDVWPSHEDITNTVNSHVQREMFTAKYSNVWDGNERWLAIADSKSALYEWNEQSTYIKEPPFFANISRDIEPLNDIRNLRALAVFGDSLTTDHISPAGAIQANSPAGEYLQSLGVSPKDFNSFGARRGNDQVMVRGTFGNLRIKNLMVPGVEGSFTCHQPSGEKMTIYSAAMKYKTENVSLIVLGGKEYGSGSSRDWAAKGTLLLGVKAVLVESFERIHRSNLVGMGVLPLQFMNSESIASHKLTGTEEFSLIGLSNDIKAGQKILVQVSRNDGTSFEFEVIARLDTSVDVEIYLKGGILNKALLEMDT
ncbi:MAG: aconitate hydratase AcnA [candidate division Zixibacteria bacterium]|nr:aconitate hydratase AcnA [candidate division Zixibacteria bacterium]